MVARPQRKLDLASLRRQQSMCNGGSKHPGRMISLSIKLSGLFLPADGVRRSVAYRWCDLLFGNPPE